MIFYKNNGKIAYKSNIIGNATTDYTRFTHPNGRILDTEGEANGISVISNYYKYYPYSLTLDKSTNGEKKGLEESESAYNLIFAHTNTDSTKYWFASSASYTGIDFTGFGLRGVGGGYLSYSSLWFSNIDSVTQTRGIRAVIKLESNVQVQ